MSTPLNIKIHAIRRHIYVYFSKLYKIFPLISNYNFSVVLVWWLNVCCVTAGGAVCLCVCLLACFKIFCLFESYFHYFVICVTFYLKCRITSYYSVVLLKQTTELKTLLIAHVTRFHNSHAVMSQTVRHNRGSCRNMDPSIWHSWRYRICNINGSLLVLSILPITILTLMLRTYDT